MTRRFRRVATIVGASGLLAAGAAGCASDGSGTASASADQAATKTTQDGARPTGGRPGAPDAAGQAKLAKALGVTTAELQQAMRAARPDASSTAQPGDQSAALARALGLSEAKVKAAMEANRPAGAPPAGGGQGGTPPAGGAAPSGSSAGTAVTPS